MSTVVADESGRVKVAQPGERFDLSRDAHGSIILRKLHPASPEPDSVPVLKLNAGSELIWPKEVSKPSSIEIARAVREQRNGR